MVAVNGRGADRDFAGHLAAGEKLMAELLAAEAVERRRAMMETHRWPSGSQQALLLRGLLMGVPEDKRTSVGLLLVHNVLMPALHPRAFTMERDDTRPRPVLEAVERAHLAFSLKDLQLLLSFEERPPLPSSGTGANREVRLAYFGVLLGRAGGLAAAGDPGATAVLDEIETRLVNWAPQLTSAQQKRLLALRQRASELSGNPSGRVLEPPAVHGVDGFGLAVLDGLGSPPWPPGVNALLRHLGSATSAAPSAKWTSQCRQLLGALASGDELVRTLLGLLVTAPPRPFERWGSVQLVLLEDNDDLVRGLVWAAELRASAWVPSLLQAVAERCLRESRGRTMRPVAVRGEKVPFACIDSLARLGTPRALAVLVQFRELVDNRAVRNVSTELLSCLRAGEA